MNPELNNSYPSSLSLPDIITSNQPLQNPRKITSSPFISDAVSENSHSVLHENSSLTKIQVNELRNSVIHELLSNSDNDRIARFSDLFDRYELGNRKHNNDDLEIEQMIFNLTEIQNCIIRGGGGTNYRNGLLYARGEQLNRIHTLIRNQSLHQKYAMVQLDPLLSNGPISQPDSLTHSRQQRDVIEDNLDKKKITTETSYAEIWRRLAIAIASIKTDYVDFYADLMQNYTAMYESFNENVQKASADAVTAGDDGNNVTFDKDKMQQGYDAFQQDVNRLNQELGSVKNWNSMTDDAKINMKITLEPAFKVDNNGKITFNMDQYNTVSGTHPAGIKDGKVSTASYQAWLASFNAAGNAFQSNMQSFAQRYSQANNTFDNINKVLSGSISALGDSAREVLKSLS